MPLPVHAPGDGHCDRGLAPEGVHVPPELESPVKKTLDGGVRSPHVRRGGDDHPVGIEDRRENRVEIVLEGTIPRKAL